MKVIAVVSLVLALAGVLSSGADAGVPFPPFCTCTTTISQTPTATACITNFQPDVVRLTPAGTAASPFLFDRVTVSTRVRDAVGDPVVGSTVLFAERSSVVNITNGGATSAMTDAEGSATITLEAASGHGLVAVCADGVALCSLEVRSPDANLGPSPTLHCGIGTGFTSVSGSDINNPLCGFLANFGLVTPGINNAWDLNCTNSVAGNDIIGGFSNRGAVLGYFGDTGTLGARNDCSIP